MSVALNDTDDRAPRPSVVTLADVTPERVTWLWPGRLPAGKLVVIDGDPSAGKSTLCLDLAARVSTGSPWPDGAPGGRPRGVLLLSAEDGIADTIAPRLEAARADRTRVHALLDVPVTVKGEDGDTVRHLPPSLPRDVGVIEHIVRTRDVGLVVIDVLMAYLNSGVDSHRDQDVRGVLHLLSAMAERTGTCVVLIRHLNKAGAGSPMYRGGGSIGIIGAARAAYIVGRDPEDPDRRVLAITKLNIGPEPPALAYRLVSDPRLGCARIEWEADPLGSDVTAATLLRAPADDEERTERDEVVQWLVDYLIDNGGDAMAADVRKAAGVAGLSWPTVQKARSKVAETKREGFGRGATYLWRLRSTPHGSPMDSMDTGSQDRAPMESMRNPWGDEGATKVPKDSTVRPLSDRSDQPISAGLTGPTRSDSAPAEGDAPDEGSTKGAKNAAQNDLPPSPPSLLPSHPPTTPAPTCEGCGLPLDPANLTAGYTTHPGCTRAA